MQKVALDVLKNRSSNRSPDTKHSVYIAEEIESIFDHSQKYKEVAPYHVGNVLCLTLLCFATEHWIHSWEIHRHSQGIWVRLEAASKCRLEEYGAKLKIAQQTWSMSNRNDEERGFAGHSIVWRCSSAETLQKERGCMCHTVASHCIAAEVPNREIDFVIVKLV